MKKLTAFRWCKGTNIVLQPQIYSANHQYSSIKPFGKRTSRNVPVVRFSKEKGHRRDLENFVTLNLITWEKRLLSMVSIVSPM